MISNRIRERIDSMNKLISIKQAGEISGLSRWQIYRWIDTGDLPHYKINKRTIRFDPVDFVEALMKTKQTRNRKS